MEKGISYLNRNFSDYRAALEEYSKKYYPQMDKEFSDASVGSWLLDINADIADNLSFHIDRVYQETNINSAQKKESVMSIARNNGFKVPGPKGSMAEVEFSCILPPADETNSSSAKYDLSLAPYIKKGTKLKAGSQVFELLFDVDFSKDFNVFGDTDITVRPLRNSNNVIVNYKVSKLATVIAGETKIYSRYIAREDIVPFMEILIPMQNVMNVESIVVEIGAEQEEPTEGDFNSYEEVIEDNKKWRFFEVDSLSQQNRWGEVIEKGKPVKRSFGYLDNENNLVKAYTITKGEWKPIRRKFITEFTDKGYLKVIFGAGSEGKSFSEMVKNASDFSKYQMSKMLNNSNLGELPESDSTIYIKYRTGGGKASNVAMGAINTISFLDVEIGNCSNASNAEKSAVRNSISVRNTTPSVSGKDMPTAEEIKFMTKYYNAAQERCVTITDYKNRIMLMPPKYGAPYKVGVSEENNKIMIYLLGINNEGNLSPIIPSTLIQNITEYLKEYRLINDYIEIKSGKVINVGFEINVYIDKGYDSAKVKEEIRSKIVSFMDSNKQEMGDKIFLGDLFKEIQSISGVVNLINIRVFNKVNGMYSTSQTSQQIKEESKDSNDGIYEIDLDESDMMLYNSGDSMTEVKYPEKDIKINIKMI